MNLRYVKKPYIEYSDPYNMLSDKERIDMLMKAVTKHSKLLARELQIKAKRPEPYSQLGEVDAWMAVETVCEAWEKFLPDEEELVSMMIEVCKEVLGECSAKNKLTIVTQANAIAKRIHGK